MKLSDIKKLNRGGYVCFFVFYEKEEELTKLVLSSGVADDEERLLAVAKSRLFEWVENNTK